MDMTLHVTLIGVLAVILLALWMYRKWLDDHDDHNIHLHNNPSDIRTVSSQQTVAKRLEMLERATLYLTVAVIAYALIIAAMAIYNAWTTSANL